MGKGIAKAISWIMAAALLLTAAPVIPVSADPGAGDELKPLKLQYLSPADKGSNERNNWERWALPLGNGHIGAMVFGRTETERVQLNEKTLWSGGVGGTDAAEGGEYQRRDPLSDAYGNVDAAGSGAMEQYINTLFEAYYSGSTAANSPPQSGSMKILPNNRSALGDYLNFADMYMDFNHSGQDVGGYRRELDLRNALSTVSYDLNGVHYTRETFTNYPDNVMVYRITADQPGSIDMVLRPIISDLGTTSGGHSKKVTKEGTVVADQDTQLITMEGKVVNNEMKFAGQFKVVNEGGTVTAQNPEADQSKGQLTVQDADSVMIYVSLATNYKNQWPEYRQTEEDYAIDYVRDRIENATAQGYEQLWQNHLDDYQELFARVELDLGGVYNENEETDQLLQTWKNASSGGSQNHYLEELYFQYGRYMAIASSRSDTLPSNLQGIWNDRVFADWQSDYHTNINLQMNYWPAYTTNLAETGTALVNYVDSLQEPGALTAEKLFGTTDAWMVNCSANALGFTGNINSTASLAPTANAFILQNVYDHYQYTQDKELLAETIYPMMVGASNFFLQTLQNGRSEADSDKLFMVPSFSSEHGPWTVGAAFDQQLIYILFQETLEAAAELGIEDDFTERLEAAMARLYPLSIGDSGQVKEWQQEGNYNRYKNQPNTKIGDDAHRHNSMLMMLHPGNQITTETPELMEAAKTTLNMRGDAATGWSMGQKFNMWTRLQDGNHAYNKLFKNLMKNGTATNLFDLHPPFQIDGNFGGTAGIAELLMQSHAGYVSILPALPDELPSGSVRGLVAAGNFVVDIDWADMRAEDVQITSRSGGRLSLKSGPVSAIIDMETGEQVTGISQDSNGAISFNTTAGHTYQVVPGETQAMLYAETVVSEIQSAGISAYEYTTETGNEFNEAFLACQRMVEQQHYMTDDVDKTVDRLLAAREALALRENEEYAAAAALHFLENAAAINYQGTDTEDQWRQRVEYDRAELKEALEAGTQESEVLLQAAKELLETGNTIAGYSHYRMNLFDFISKAKTIEQGSRSDEVWEAYNLAIAQAVKIFVNPRATEKDLKNANSRLKKVVETMESVFTISASAEGNGTIDPSGEVEVLGGSSQRFAITPGEAGAVLDVLLDGYSVGAVEEYTIDDVTQNMEIKALFRDDQPVKSAAEILLDNAVSGAEQLGGDSYVGADWQLVETALEEARAADRTNEDDMKAKAENLLTAMDGLRIWGDPVRTEAEGGLYPVADFWTAAVYKDPAYWGDFELGDNKIVGGYPETGPVTATGSAGKDGQWVKQEISGASQNNQVLSKTDGAWVKYKFTGSRVRYITESAVTGARVSVYIDGQLIDAVDCWEPSSSTNPRGVVRFDSEDYDLNLYDGDHELMLIGNTQPGAAHPIFRVDAFDEYTDISQVTAKRELAELIAATASLQEISYTPETWEVLQQQQQAAETVFADQTADQQAVADALANLQAARDGLEGNAAVITEVTALQPVTAALGTTAEELRGMLQESVVVTAGSRKIRVDVDWMLDGFDGSKAGKITLKGTLVLPESADFSNPDGLEAAVAVTVEKGKAQVVLGNLKQTEGSVTAVTVKTQPEGLKTEVLYNGSKTLPQVPGSYQVEATVTDDNYEGSGVGTLVIEKKDDHDGGDTELEIAKQQLQSEISRVKVTYGEGQKNYTAETWNRFVKAYKDALSNSGSGNKAVLEKVCTELRDAYEGLRQQAPKALAAPRIGAVTAVAGTKGLQVRVSVKKVANARSYVIYRKVNGKTRKIGTTLSGTFYDKKLYAGKNVRYTAVAVPKDTAKYTESRRGPGRNIKVGKFKGKVSLSQRSRQVTIRWSKNKGAKGYAVYRSDKKYGTYRRIKTIRKGSTLKYTDKKVRRGKRYYYKVTAKIGKNYTTYGSVRSIRVKK